MSAPPYMKLYVADYLGDTHHLSVVEHGAYLLLLMAMWRTGGTLPAADANLSKLARCTSDQWAEIRSVVLPFFRRRGGRISHNRLSLEMAKYEDTSGKRSEAGKKGASEKANRNRAPSPANASSAASNSRYNQNQNQKESSEDKSSANGSAEDLDATGWLSAVKVLTGQGGLSEPDARRFFGRLLAQNKLLARDMLPSCAGALVNATQDPKAYLTRAAAGVSKRRTEGSAAKHVGFV